MSQDGSASAPAFLVLGPLQVVADREALRLAGPHQRALLALLLLEAPRAISVDRLIDELWGERPPATAAHAVQVHVSALRKLLCDGTAVRNSAAGYTLDVAADQIDARRFERLIEQGEHLLSADPEGAREALTEALALWRGAPLAELGQFAFAREERARLEDLRTRADEDLVEARLVLGEHREVVPTLMGLVAADPLRERPRRLLMLALYRDGRHAEALSTYRDLAAALDEVGLQPGPELRDLETLILRHDESLQESVPARAPGSDQATDSRRRKVVTTLCCGFVAPQDFDPEALLEATEDLFAVVGEIVERHGGTVTRPLGDAVLAVFGTPQVREDDASRAVRAAVTIHERIATATTTLRIGVNTGLALVDERNGAVVGESVGSAMRLEQVAAPGEILLSEETVALVGDAVKAEPIPMTLTPSSEVVIVYRLLAVDPLARAARQPRAAPLIGRERELGVLLATWNRARQQHACRLFTLLGVAGVGKSRLVDELLESLAGAATLLRGRCLPYGEGITFWPVIEALTTLGPAAQPLLERIETGATVRPEELFWEVRRVLETAAAERPVILHIDDLQWAEPMLLRLLDHVAAFSRGAPILLLCVARPELLDEPAWDGRKPDATALVLEPLDAAASEELLEHLGDGLEAEIRSALIEAGGGNPLFLHELAAFAREHGAVTVPPTIQAVLAARLERLEPRERELLEHAAIEGEVFHAGAIEALASATPAPDVAALAAELVRKDLIHPLAGDDAFRFRHLLIRDAAYESVSKRERAALHERMADWLEGDSSEVAERDELAGWHLEQTVSYQRELGRPIDAAVARRGAEHLHAAGRRAARRGDTAAARKLLDRAYALAAGDAELAPRVALDLAEQLIEGEDLARVDALLTVAEGTAETAAHAALVRFHWLTLVRLEEATKLETELPDMLTSLEASGDESGLAKAHLLGFWFYSQAAQVEPAAEHAMRAADHACSAGDRGLRSRALALYIVALLHGSHDGLELTSVLDAVEAENLGPYVAALVEFSRGEVERLGGDTDGGRLRMQRGVTRFREMRIHPMAAGSQHFYTWTELAGGDPAQALPGLLEIDADLAAVGECAFRSTIQATLSQVAERLGDLARARAAADLAEELTAPSDLLTLALLSAARARLALRNRELDAAERFARDAVGHAFRTQLPFLQGDTQLHSAHVLAARGRLDDARAAVHGALERYKVRDDVPRKRYAEAMLEDLDRSGRFAGTQAEP